MAYIDKSGELGLAGEKVVINYLSSLGQTISHSVDKFDSEKDFMANGLKIEVKTQNPYVLKNSFTIPKSQLKKCLNVDFIYFVSVPHHRYKHSSDGWIYKVDPKIMIYNHDIVKDGTERYLIPINQSAVVKESAVSPSDLIHLKKFSTSKY
jgi:hypothetical protein